MKLSLLLALALPVTLLAQTPNPAGTPGAGPTPSITPGLWKCQLPGGTYEVAIRSIISVSSHEYVIDNAARVTEVNVDTSGSMVVRFYYLEPNTVVTPPAGLGAATYDKAQSLLTEAQNRTGTADAWQKVVKSYPTSTHANTVEYRLASKDQLTALFNSVEASFRTGRPAVYTTAGASSQ